MHSWGIGQLVKKLTRNMWKMYCLVAWLGSRFSDWWQWIRRRYNIHFSDIYRWQVDSVTSWLFP